MPRFLSFCSGVVVGAVSDAYNQIKSGESELDFGKMIDTGVRYGVINTLNAYTCALGGNLDLITSIALNIPFGFTYGAITLALDVAFG